ncbi:hypothetical protein EDD16DRAFT_1602762 [Pisolithus croceorrhizus]|nr:hypothetical protein EDD16DRAFT_1602762 [Pisolithus croceorrhizus]KAI6117800.1 hypothetical protein EV401DRAFT_1967569 [Pisolithus croceorrhizus]
MSLYYMTYVMLSMLLVHTRGMNRMSVTTLLARIGVSHGSASRDAAHERPKTEMLRKNPRKYDRPGKEFGGEYFGDSPFSSVTDGWKIR